MCRHSEHAMEKDGFESSCIGRWNIPGSLLSYCGFLSFFFSKKNDDIYQDVGGFSKLIHFMLMEITTKRLCFLMQPEKWLKALSFQSDRK